MQTALTERPGFAHVHSFRSTLPGRLTIGLASTLVIALAARISFPLPFTPVPFTLQPLAVLGVGLALGPVDGFFALLAYLAEGACGLPVFSPTGLGGIAQLVGPTGGYLLAYPFVAAVVGGLCRMLSRRLSQFAAAAIAGTAGTAVLFIAGAGRLMAFAHLSPRSAWIAGIAPFLPGEAVKILAAAGIYSTLRRARHNDAPASRI
jgi:biotin transport system substrate-specific component